MRALDLALQVWDSATGKLKKDLTYQSEEMFMMHDEAVLCINFSRDNELLVSGGRCWAGGGTLTWMECSSHQGPHWVAVSKNTTRMLGLACVLKRWGAAWVAI